MMTPKQLQFWQDVGLQLLVMCVTFRERGYPVHFSSWQAPLRGLFLPNLGRRVHALSGPFYWNRHSSR